VAIADATALISVSVGAVSAFLAYLSARASRDSVRASRDSVEAFRADLEHSRGTTRHELARAFEADFAKQYDAIWEVLGPWKDPVEVDKRERRVVHDMLATMSSVYLALEQKLIAREQADYLGELFGDWLGLPKARWIWEKVFSTPDQAASWPPGFIPWVDSMIGTASPAEPAA
jgi:hypothetical protein